MIIIKPKISKFLDQRHLSFHVGHSFANSILPCSVTLQALSEVLVHGHQHKNSW